MLAKRWETVGIQVDGLTVAFDTISGPSGSAEITTVAGPYWAAVAALGDVSISIEARNVPVGAVSLEQVGV